MIAIFFMALLIFAVKRRVIAASVLVGLISAGVLLFELYFGVMLSDVKAHHSLWHQGHVYRLMSEWDEGFFVTPRDTERYVVLQCDASGLICDQYATPYSLELEGYGPGIIKTFDQSGALYIDATDQSLKLRVGDEVYPVSATAQVTEG